ncbi:uncharacterized protein LOC117327517 isoform X2 [Pecten maximus]|uniref:uncharacterized protein LOC117327517 isoform X2 n=1 Tax=Pecten maximus TaxID=6579 RepID=UPI001458138B|nr:uncharacterized protein LOC117327517 isoform X2 [Pecten maximus]
MNQVVLRSHKGEYLPGEDIYGVVYLNVVSTTTGRGIRLKFQGCEHFVYRHGHPPAEEKFEAKKHYLDYPDIDLYKSQDIFMLGSYIFPFRIRLLTEIPASFDANGIGTGCNWTAKVTYTLSAEVIDASNLNTTQTIVVYHPLGRTESSSTPKLVTNRLDVPYLLFLKKPLFVTAKLQRNVQQTGDSMKVKIIITNQTNRDVSNITVRLIREITFVAKGGLSSTKICKDDSIQETRDRIFICPEKGPFIVQDIPVEGCLAEILNRGLDNFIIPLKEPHDQHSPIPSSVAGNHIQCRYVVEILVRLENNASLVTTLPVPCIWHQKNKQWADQSIPDWVYNTEVMLSESPFSVPENVLSGEVFAGIPRFQALTSPS